mgnify:CR=1 FL=1
MVLFPTHSGDGRVPQDRKDCTNLNHQYGYTGGRGGRDGDQAVAVLNWEEALENAIHVATLHWDVTEEPQRIGRKVLNRENDYFPEDDDEYNGGAPGPAEDDRGPVRRVTVSGGKSSRKRESENPDGRKATKPKHQHHMVVPPSQPGDSAEARDRTKQLEELEICKVIDMISGMGYSTNQIFVQEECSIAKSHVLYQGCSFVCLAMEVINVFLGSWSRVTELSNEELVDEAEKLKKTSKDVQDKLACCNTQDAESLAERWDEILNVCDQMEADRAWAEKHWDPNGKELPDKWKNSISHWIPAGTSASVGSAVESKAKGGNRNGDLTDAKISKNGSKGKQKLGSQRAKPMLPFGPPPGLSAPPALSSCRGHPTPRWPEHVQKALPDPYALTLATPEQYDQVWPNVLDLLLPHVTDIVAPDEHIAAKIVIMNHRTNPELCSSIRSPIAFRAMLVDMVGANARFMVEEFQMLLTAYREFPYDKSRQSYITRTAVHDLLQEQFGNMDASLAESFISTNRANMRPGDTGKSPAPWKVAVLKGKKGKGGKATREDRQTPGLADSI